MSIKPLAVNPRKAIAHLIAADPALGVEIARVGKFNLVSRPATFHWFCRGIIGQQLSVAVAATIGGRFTALVGDHCEPADVLAVPVESLRAAGLSGAKVAAVHGLAEHWIAERFDENSIREMSDDALVDTFVRVRGIGPWTVKMFLIFCLRRPNVMPFEDYGIRAAIKKIDVMDRLPTMAEAAARGERWAPYATVAAHYCWRSLDS